MTVVVITRNNDGSNDVEQDHTKNTARKAKLYLPYFRECWSCAR